MNQMRKILLAGLTLAVTIPAVVGSAGEFWLTSNLDGRSIRRIYLDLTGRLPSMAERQTFSNSEFDLFSTLTEMIEAPAAAASLAKLAPSIWQYDETKLPDLERMIADGDTNLAANLTATVRRAVVDEIRHNLQTALEGRQTLEQIFGGRSTRVAETARSLWLLPAGTSAGSSADPFQITTYNDSRPPLGLSMTNGFLATIDSHLDETARIKTKNLMEVLHCTDFHHPDAHQFSDLTEAQLRGNLIDLANSTASCAGCHKSYNDLRPVFTGVSRPTSFAAWGVAIAGHDNGFYAGHQFLDIESLANKFSNDPRLLDCFLSRLISSLHQRKFDDSTDFETKLTMMGLLDLDRENIHKALRILFLSSNYWQTPLSSGPDSLRLRLSGYRFLTRSHFESIASDLLGDHSISFSNEINPLVSGDVDSERQIPGSAYFAAVNDGVRALAKALVEREFSLSADARKLFSMLPDGAASEPSASLLRETIAQLWEFLTGEETNVTSDEVTQLASLFETVLGIDDQVSAAWEAVLVGIMLDPKFLSY